MVALERTLVGARPAPAVEVCRVGGRVSDRAMELSEWSREPMLVGVGAPGNLGFGGTLPGGFDANPQTGQAPLDPCQNLLGLSYAQRLALGCYPTIENEVTGTRGQTTENRVTGERCDPCLTWQLDPASRAVHAANEPRSMWGYDETDSCIQVDEMCEMPCLVRGAAGDATMSDARLEVVHAAAPFEQPTLQEKNAIAAALQYLSDRVDIVGWLCCAKLGAGRSDCACLVDTLRRADFKIVIQGHVLSRCEGTFDGTDDTAAYVWHARGPERPVIHVCRSYLEAMGVTRWHSMSACDRLGVLAGDGWFPGLVDTLLHELSHLCDLGGACEWRHGAQDGPRGQCENARLLGCDVVDEMGYNFTTVMRYLHDCADCGPSDFCDSTNCPPGRAV